MTAKTISGNSQFQKTSSLRWTWESPVEIKILDQIIASKRFCVTDVAVVPKFYTESGKIFLHKERRESRQVQNPRTITIIIYYYYPFAALAGFWENSAMDSIDEENDRLVGHLHDCTRKVQRFKTTKRRLSPEELTRLCEGIST
ncbi:hypothetical protein RB195_010928 [Necator americanus]|uniref:Uncharacterized protein n=1 Tax=Necator americanus TaxID=51031 RepID=A0ABR1D1B4_NECAM